MTNKERYFYDFGPFRIDPEHRLLLRENQTLPLQSKAFDVLLALVQNSERVVSKDDLLKIVWPETFVEESNLAQHIFVLRKTLGDAVGENRYIVTVPGRGYRFAEKVQVVGEEEDKLLVESHSRSRLVIEEKSVVAISPAPASTVSVSAPGRKPWRWILGVAFLLILAVGLTRYMRKPPPLKEADLVLVSDFVNATGEPIFDDTLKQALTVKLAESPYFNVALDAQTRRTLGLMERPADERVVPPMAREVCQREGAKALIGGSIVRLGNKYVLDLDAVNCLTGDSLAHEEIEAANREQVLRQLGRAIVPVRRALGEALSSIQKFDTPIEQATTKSLAALKAYTQGDQARVHGNEGDTIAFYKMAIELDPDFAIAYARLGAVYHNLQQGPLGDEYLRKAFERREHISEKEKFYIQAHYYIDSTGESDKAIQIYELWTQVYPHDWIPFNNASNEYDRIGDMEKAIGAGQRALQLNPNHEFPYGVLAQAYLGATRFAEAKAVCEKAIAQKLDGFIIHRVLHRVALMEGDQKSAQRESDWSKGDPLESWMMNNQASNAMSLGRVREARRLFERARANALEKQTGEFAGAIALDEASSEASLGYKREARDRAEESLRIAPGHQADAALVFAHAGDARRAEALAEEVARKYPADLLTNNVTLPCVHAAAQMSRSRPSAAVAELQKALPYDLSDSSDGETIYDRGYAYLQMRAGKEAAQQFQKILDNRGAADFYWPLAHLGLGRAYALSGDTSKSRAAYREFFELWKNADPDVPILKEARMEYAKLQ